MKKNISFFLLISVVTFIGSSLFGFNPKRMPLPIDEGGFFYISTNGSDANPGTETQPFRTINRATRVVMPGDTVLIRAGIYYEDVKPSTSGLPGKYITYKAYGDGEVIIDAQKGKRAGCIEINNQSYLKFVGLTVRGANSYSTWPRAGISITDGAKNIILDNITAYGNYFGVMAYGKNTPVSFITIKNSRTFNPSTKAGNTHYGIFFYKKVYDSSIINNHVAYALPEAQSYGIEIGTEYPGKQANGPRRILITGNEVDHNESQGIHTWNAVGVLISSNSLHDNGATGIQIEDGSENIVIENNVSENNAQKYEYETGTWIHRSKNVLVRGNILRSNKIGLNITSSQRVIVHDNYVYLNNRGAESLVNAAGLIVDNSVFNLSITQNTFYKNGVSGMARGGVNFGSDDKSGKLLPLCNHIRFINNIVSETANNWDLVFFYQYQNGHNLVQDSCSDFVSDYNDFFNIRDLLLSWNGHDFAWLPYLTASRQDAHSLTQDPLFVNPAKYDFHLQPNSPLIARGMILARTIGAGDGNIVNITDAGYFSDGFGIGDGDTVVVGGTEVRIVAIDYIKNTITIDHTITWNTNDAVSFPFSNAAPDIGAGKSN